jgi:hypothetical protein
VHPHNVLPVEIAVLQHGSRLYVIRLESRSVGTVFDTLTKSLRFTS